MASKVKKRHKPRNYSLKFFQELESKCERFFVQMVRSLIKHDKELVLEIGKLENLADVLGISPSCCSSIRYHVRAGEIQTNYWGAGIIIRPVCGRKFPMIYDIEYND